MQEKLTVLQLNKLNGSETINGWPGGLPLEECQVLDLDPAGMQPDRPR
jgi:hypothetical protein